MIEELKQYIVNSDDLIFKLLKFNVKLYDDDDCIYIAAILNWAAYNPKLK